MTAMASNEAQGGEVVSFPLGGHRALIAGLRTLAASATAGVVAVVVETSGSTYRKPGALVLLDAAGVRIGALSGGCLESELEAAAREVLDEGVARAVRFDTSGDEDRVFGSGTGCGGSSRLLLLPVPADGSPLRDALLDGDARGLAVRIGLRDAPDHIGSGEARVGRTRMDARRYRFDRHGNPLSGGAPLAASLEVTVRPPLRLLLLGAGPETRPLLQLTRLLGWQVELIEHRQRWARFAEGCGIDRVHGGGPDDLSSVLERARFDAALVMNHNYLLDARCLAGLAETDIGYVGLLGPASRRDDLMGEVGGTIAAHLRRRLHAPVGLPLGGEGAEAIALAIVAQLQNQLSRTSDD